jgi:hypothetical protein
MIIINNIKYVKVHVISDLSLPLDEEFNETVDIEINCLLKTLDELAEATSIIISKLDNKVLIANNGPKMVALTLKEKDINWHDLMSYRLTSYIYRH